MTIDQRVSTGRWLAEVEDLTVLSVQNGVPVALVDRVSFGVEAGEAVGLVGESGCGKTLTVRALAGLLPGGLQAGKESRVSFDGRLLSDWKPTPHGSEIGYVFQDPTASLNPVLRVGDQIAEVVRVVLGESAKTATARAVALLEEVGIDDPAAKARR